MARQVCSLINWKSSGKDNVKKYGVYVNVIINTTLWVYTTRGEARPCWCWCDSARRFRKDRLFSFYEPGGWQRKYFFMFEFVSVINHWPSSFPFFLKAHFLRSFYDKAPDIIRIFYQSHKSDENARNILTKLILCYSSFSHVNTHSQKYSIVKILYYVWY